MKKILVLLAILAAVCLTSCRNVEYTSIAADSNGLERRIERFSKPDEYGVMCYQDIGSANTLSCVRVARRYDEQMRFK